MGRDIISKATRNEFREAMVGLVLREIDTIFDGAGFSPMEGYVATLGGQRRNRVEQYYAAIDFSSPSQISQLANAYTEVVDLFRKRIASGDVRAGSTVEELVKRMGRDGFAFKDGRFAPDKLRASLVHAASLITLSEESIREHLDKAQVRVDSGDHSGAIASAYTLLEGFMKALLRQTQTPFKADEGDIRVLYKLVAGPLNLSPAGEHLESYLKGILQGLSSQVAGLFEVANKASDRHARKYNPARHHAKLAVNCVFTLCDFLLDSYHYQSQRRSPTKDSERAQ